MSFMENTSLRKAIVIGAVLVLVMFVAAQIYRQSHTTHTLPIIAKLPPFSLLDQDGKEISEASLKGKVHLVNFIFTHCQGPCPLLTERMAYYVADFSGSKRFAGVSISTDPERDTPERLKKIYPNAPSGIWYFLTGKKADIDKLMIEGFKIGTYEDPAMHSTRFVLVDEDLNIRAYYEGTDGAQLRLIRDDIRRLLREKH
jgi:protein SCO1/2